MFGERIAPLGDARDPLAEHRAHQAMGPGHEFDTIRMLMARWGDLAVDIGDDAAVLPPEGDRRRVITTDASVEGAHFRREWLSPFEIGVRAAAAAISDVAAMGARADAVLLALVVPDAWRAVIGEVADGFGGVVRAAGARIVGGNLSRGDAFSITTTVIGSSTHVVSRRGALPGDVLMVTGALGGPGAAIAAWYAGGQPRSWARTRFVAPVPRLREGQALAAAGARAMLDISDGLVADARHLAAASGVQLVIHAPLVPCGPGIDLRTALSSGEEYELLVALPPQVAEQLLRDWPAWFDVPLTAIGTVFDRSQAQSNTESDLAAQGVLVSGLDGKDSVTDSASRVEFVAGHDHFSR